MNEYFLLLEWMNINLINLINLINHKLINP